MLRTGGAPRRACFTALITASLLAAVSTMPGVAAASDGPGDRYGVTDSYLRVVSPATRSIALSALYAGGVRLVRSDMGWGQVEPSPPSGSGLHYYDWSKHDAWVTELAQAGLRLYPIIDYGTAWNAVTPGQWQSRPRDPQQYAAFAAAVVGRYGPSGTFWAEHPSLPRLPVQSVEIWNEENAQQFWYEQAGAPADYARMYVAARAAVKAVAPSTEVVVGGLVDQGADSFLRGMAAAVPGIGAQLDAVAYHPYLMDPATAADRIAAVRRTLTAIGAASAPIELTEVGWSTLEASDDARGANLAEISRLATNPALGVSKVIAFAAMSNEGDPGQWDQWFGLLNHDGTPKSTFLRWAAAIAVLNAQQAVTTTLPVVTPPANKSAPSSTGTTTPPTTTGGKSPAASKPAKKTKTKAKKKSTAASRAAKARAARAKARAAKARAARARAARARAAKARAATTRTRTASVSR